MRHHDEIGRQFAGAKQLIGGFNQPLVQPVILIHGNAVQQIHDGIPCLCAVVTGRQVNEVMLASPHDVALEVAVHHLPRCFCTGGIKFGDSQRRRCFCRIGNNDFRWNQSRRKDGRNGRARRGRFCRRQQRSRRGRRSDIDDDAFTGHGRTGRELRRTTPQAAGLIRRNYSVTAQTPTPVPTPQNAV